MQNKDTRKDLRISNTIAMEIGGNDMVNYTPTLIFMPWKYWTYEDPTTGNEVKGIVDVVIHNIKVLIYFFRHPLIDRNVLVMGNFPTLSYSPSLGHVGDYFASFKKMTDVYYKKWEEENRFIHVERDDQIENLTILQDVIVAVLSLVNPGYSIPYTLNELFGVKLPGILEKLYSPLVPRKEYEDDPYYVPDQMKAVNWYYKWVYTNSKSATTAASFGLYLMQPGLETMVNQMRDKTRYMKSEISNNEGTKTYTANNRKGGNYVHFLPLFHLMVNGNDCQNYYQCWVANPILYRDNLPGHVNHFGYFLWANSLSHKLVELYKENNEENDWNYKNALKNPEGKIEEPPEDFNIAIVPVDEDGNEVKPEDPTVTPIDALLLLCFFFGNCHF